MHPENLVVDIPRKEGFGESRKEVQVWPLVEKALETVGADDNVREAALKAAETSDGCCAIANYIEAQQESRQIKLDVSYRVPLLVAAITLAQDDDGLDSYYCTGDNTLYLEADVGQYVFSLAQHLSTDWAALVDEVVGSYDESDEESRAWALDWLLDYNETDLEAYRPDPDGGFRIGGGDDES